MGGALTSIMCPKKVLGEVESLKAKTLSDCKEILVDNPGNRACRFAIEYLNSDEGKALNDEGKEYDLY